MLDFHDFGFSQNSDLQRVAKEPQIFLGKLTECFRRSGGAKGKHFLVPFN
ncbi:hypothetical protein ACRRTK_011545 [Alexandromys fortis]